jgi:AcrR family transcriptional regulator
MTIRARRKAQRPGEILEAAFEAFAERGYSATRMEDIAARAGVTKGAIYLYFETKERLFEEMVRSHSGAVLADADAMLAGAQGTCVEKLRAFLGFLYSRCPQDRRGREIIRFMVSDGKSFPSLVEEYYRDFVGPAMRMVGGLLAEGAAKGEFRPEITRESAEIIIAPAVFLSVQRLIFGEGLALDEDAYVAAHIDMALNGLLAPAHKTNSLQDSR